MMALWMFIRAIVKPNGRTEIKATNNLMCWQYFSIISMTGGVVVQSTMNEWFNEWRNDQIKVNELMNQWILNYTFKTLMIFIYIENVEVIRMLIYYLLTN